MDPIRYIDTPSTALKLVRPRHREIMRRLVCGQRQREIARELGLNEGRLSIIISSPLFQVELKKMERDVRAKAIESIGDVAGRIAKLQGPAVDVLEEIVVNPSNKDYGAKLRKDTAVTVLEMAGAKKQRNEEGMSDFAQFISEAYTVAKQRALDQLNESLEGEISQRQLPDGLAADDGSGHGAIDISGEVLSIDEAEDEALVAYAPSEPIPATDAESAVSPGDVAGASPTPQPSVEASEPPIPVSGNGNGNGNGSVNTAGKAGEAAGGLKDAIISALRSNGLSADSLQKLIDKSD